MAQVAAPQRDRHLGHAHRRAGCPELARCTPSIASTRSALARGSVRPTRPAAQHAFGRVVAITSERRGIHQRSQGAFAPFHHPPDEGREDQLHRQLHLAAGTTMVFARDIHELLIMLSRYWKSMPLGLANRITQMLSSAVGMSRATKGLLVSTTGTRWKLTWCA